MLIYVSSVQIPKYLKQIQLDFFLQSTLKFLYTLVFKSLASIRYWCPRDWRLKSLASKRLKKVSYAHQDCTYLIKNVIISYCAA